ncbi:MAG: hypothetical protein PHG08_03385 [Bacilli bacterium]|jgi:Na+-transporting NADH:ubiquinone oxidoreductase subunit NqrF|nr:hypothetical protein [Bacilli bacterium]HHU24681.1 hypothetical protein [Acholeplasmataceae bacterium]
MFWKEILILLGALTLFFGTFFLNRRIKVPEGTEIPEECLGCSNPFCSVKDAKDKETVIKELRECLEKEKEEVENE